jgi:hypothetical protein
MLMYVYSLGMAKSAVFRYTAYRLGCRWMSHTYVPCVVFCVRRALFPVSIRVHDNMYYICIVHLVYIVYLYLCTSIVIDGTISAYICIPSRFICMLSASL